MNSSHIDEYKIKEVPEGVLFGYRDIVNESFPEEEHVEDGKRFKEEVLSGRYENIKIAHETDSRLLYKKERRKGHGN